MAYFGSFVNKILLILLVVSNLSNFSNLNSMVTSQLDIGQRIRKLEKELEDFSTDLFTNQVHISQKKLKKKISKFIDEYNDICWDFDSKAEDHNRILAMRKIIEDIIKFKDNHEPRLL